MACIQIDEEPSLYGFGDGFPNYVPGGKALDIGCGNGIYLSYLKHHGWDVVGIDMSATGAATAKRVFNIDVFVGQVQDAPFAANSFDYIHMSHVIEHLPDPLETMQRVARLLKPAGELYVETPNTDSFGASHSGPYWFPWETPRHLFLFSPDTLRQTVHRSGFLVKKLSTTVQDYYKWEQTYRLEDAPRRKLASAPSLRAFY